MSISTNKQYVGPYLCLLVEQGAMITGKGSHRNSFLVQQQNKQVSVLYKYHRSNKKKWYFNLSTHESLFLLDNPHNHDTYVGFGCDLDGVCYLSLDELEELRGTDDLDHLNFTIQRLPKGSYRVSCSNGNELKYSIRQKTGGLSRIFT